MQVDVFDRESNAGNTRLCGVSSEAQIWFLVGLTEEVYEPSLPI